MSNRGKEILIWAILVIGLGAIVFGIYGAVAQPGEMNGDVSNLIAPITADDRTKGSEAAKAVFVEYSDFECPACGYFYGMIKTLEEEKGDAVRIAYRHFPLAQHRYARVTAQASEAAGAQGKFWEMHDILFEKQEEWSKSTSIQQNLLGYAMEIGLDVDQFLVDVQASDIDEKIDRNVAMGTAQKITGTPSFFLNGKLIQFRSYEELKQLVEVELSK